MRLLLWLAVCIFYIHCTAGETKPNILFILVDDLGNADASFNAQRTLKNATPPIYTPNIDRLANDGLTLLNYYTSPICGPSRSSILTGRFNFRWGNPFPAVVHGDLTPDANTIADELKLRGYQNHFIGKWGIDKGNQHFDDKADKYLPPYRQGFGPLDRGFDTFYGLYQSAHNHYSKKFFNMTDWHRHNETHQLDYPDIDPEVDQYSSDLFTRETISLLEQHAKGERNAPFFIHLSYTAPHDPLQSPENYMNHPSCQGKSHRRKIYCGMVMSIDEGIRQITKTLEETQLLDNTIIVFTSDNGGYPYVGGYNYPYRGVKQTVYEGGVRSPAFIKAPAHFHLGKAGAGEEYTGLFHAVDWSATLISMADQMGHSKSSKSEKFSLLGEIDGLDLSDALMNKVPKRNSMVLHVENYLNITAYIYENYKLILGETSGDSDVFEEPDDSWSVHSRQRNVERMVREVATEAMDEFIGIDSWIYQWAVHFLFEKMGSQGIFEFWKYPLCGDHPDGELTSDEETRPLIIPVPQWDRHKGVQLFDLQKDPYETTNIAFQNKELVNELVARLTEEFFEKESQPLPQIGAIVFNFGTRMYMFRNLLAILAFCFTIGPTIILVLLVKWAFKFPNTPATETQKNKN